MKKYLKNITIEKFKSLENKSFEFSPKLNVITGVNGSGKTSLLESIFYSLKQNVITNFSTRFFELGEVKTQITLNDDTTITENNEELVDDLMIFLLDACGCDLPQSKVKDYALRLKKESKKNQIILVTFQQDIIDLADNLITL